MDSKEHMALVYGYGEELELDRNMTSADSGEKSGKKLLSRSLEEVLVKNNDFDSDYNRGVRGCLLSRQEATEMIMSSSSSFSSSAPSTLSPMLARIHSCCFTGETLGSTRCDCKEQLQEAMRLMNEAGRGVILYLQQEGRGIGLKDKLKAYNLIDLGHDTLTANLALNHPADARTYRIASLILQDLSIPSIRLLTNNPHKVEAMERDGVRIAERVPMYPRSWAVEGRTGVDDRDGYLVTKARRMGHLLILPTDIVDRVDAMADGNRLKQSDAEEVDNDVEKPCENIVERVDATVGRGASAGREAEAPEN